MKQAMRAMKLLLVGACVLLALETPAAVQAKARPGRYKPAPDGQGTTDTVTHLIWQIELSAGSYNFEDAKKYCAQLTPLAGGWRLPTLRELLSLVDPTELPPAIDHEAFPGTPSDPGPNEPGKAGFWSSTDFAGQDGTAWFVNFQYGSTNHEAKSVRKRVRCVRANP